MRTVIVDGFTVAGKVLKKGQEFDERNLIGGVKTVKEQREYYNGRVMYIKPELYDEDKNYGGDGRVKNIGVVVNARQVTDEEEREETAQEVVKSAKTKRKSA